MTRLSCVAALAAFLLSACSKDSNQNDGGQNTGQDAGHDAGPPLPFISDPARADAGCDWPQWGQNWAHVGQSCAIAQGFHTALATVEFDPFVPLEVAEADGLFGRDDLFTHYGSPLVVGDDLYMAVKSGAYPPCSPPGSGAPAPCGFDAWNQQVWTVKHLAWVGSSLMAQASFASSWKPPPWQIVDGWEPVFQHAVHDDVVWVPMAAGTVAHLDRQLGNVQAVNPFNDTNINRY